MSSRCLTRARSVLPCAAMSRRLPDLTRGTSVSFHNGMKRCFQSGAGSEQVRNAAAAEDTCASSRCLLLRCASLPSFGRPRSNRVRCVPRDTCLAQKRHAPRAGSRKAPTTPSHPPASQAPMPHAAALNSQAQAQAQGTDASASERAHLDDAGERLGRGDLRRGQVGVLDLLLGVELCAAGGRARERTVSSCPASVRVRARDSSCRRPLPVTYSPPLSVSPPLPLPPSPCPSLSPSLSLSSPDGAGEETYRGRRA